MASILDDLESLAAMETVTMTTSYQRGCSVESSEDWYEHSDCQSSPTDSWDDCLLLGDRSNNSSNTVNSVQETRFQGNGCTRRVGNQADCVLDNRQCSPNSLGFHGDSIMPLYISSDSDGIHGDLNINNNGFISNRSRYDSSSSSSSSSSDGNDFSETCTDSDMISDDLLEVALDLALMPHSHHTPSSPEAILADIYLLAGESQRWPRHPLTSPATSNDDSFVLDVFRNEGPEYGEPESPEIPHVSPARRSYGNRSPRHPLTSPDTSDDDSFVLDVFRNEEYGEPESPESPYVNPARRSYGNRCNHGNCRRKPSLSNGKTTEKKKRRGNHLYKFLHRVLLLDQHSDVITWVDRKNGVFKFVDTVQAARMWGETKNKPMTFEHMARAIRHYYKDDVMHKVTKKRLQYRFGANADIMRMREEL